MKKLLIASLTLLTSCASIIEGNEQEISIRTEPAVQAKCGVSGTGFEKEVAAPGKFTVSRSYYPLSIRCTPNEGGKEGTVKVLSDVSNWGYGGAVLGVGVGAVVDASTGDAFEYPKEIVVTLGENKTLGVTSMNSNVDFNKK